MLSSCRARQDGDVHHTRTEVAGARDPDGEHADGGVVPPRSGESVRFEIALTEQVGIDAAAEDEQARVLAGGERVGGYFARTTAEGVRAVVIASAATISGAASR
jgi:hypothetical protein